MYFWVINLTACDGQPSPERVQNKNIFISNRYWEGQQVALLEAMASGCYSLSHIWAGAEEMLPVDNLYITNGELQTKIIEYCDKSEDEKRKCQARLRDLACDKFDIEQTRF